MALLNPAATLPTSSQDALEIFDERYIAALALAAAQPSGWVAELGEVHSTPQLTTRYPMARLALKYEETKNQGGRFRTIGEKDVELTVAEYDDGVEIELLKLLTNSFSARRWESAPEEMVRSEMQFRLKIIADALHANTELCGWDGLTLFNDAHFANGRNSEAGTFDNLQASAKDCADLTNIEAECTFMAEVKDENGHELGVRADTIAVPRQKFQKLANLLKQDFVPSAAGTATMTNPYSGGALNIVEMTKAGDNDANDWYLLDSKLIARGLVPWTLAKLEIPMPGFDALSLRRYDESSEKFRDTGKIAVSSHIYYGFKFLFPHAIRKIAGA